MTRWKLVRDPTKYTGSSLRKPTHRFFAFSYSLSGVVICWRAPPPVSKRRTLGVPTPRFPAPPWPPNFLFHVIPGRSDLDTAAEKEPQLSRDLSEAKASLGASLPLALPAAGGYLCSHDVFYEELAFSTSTAEATSSFSSTTPELTSSASEASCVGSTTSGLGFSSTSV